MKQKFSTKWKASKQPRKKRKYLANAPLHTRQRFMSSMLDKKLKDKLKMKNLEVRKEDVVKVLRGKFKGKQGKVLAIDRRNIRISIEGVQRTKKDGNKVSVWFHPSKVKIIEIKEDKKRLNKTKKEKTEKKEEKEEEKPVSKEKEKTKKSVKKKSNKTKSNKGKK